jgi:FkbM family methyltransferase
MQMIGLRRFMPPMMRKALRGPWMKLLEREREMRDRQLYTHFVMPGSLVFDIGSNIGDKIAAFLALGAKVVSVEPNPDCVEQIRRRFEREIKTGALQIEPVAVAAGTDELTLSIFKNESAMTTGSREFMQFATSVVGTPIREIRARATTFDTLVARHGLPSFAKIDVEGMDSDVLKTISVRPLALSFEYHTADDVWENTRECFQQVRRLGFREANFTQMAEADLLLDQWVPLDAAFAQVENWRRERRNSWGDVFVR